MRNCDPEGSMPCPDHTVNQQQRQDSNLGLVMPHLTGHHDHGSYWGRPGSPLQD